MHSVDKILLVVAPIVGVADERSYHDKLVVLGLVITAVFISCDIAGVQRRGCMKVDKLLTQVACIKAHADLAGQISPQS